MNTTTDLRIKAMELAVAASIHQVASIDAIMDSADRIFKFLSDTKTVVIEFEINPEIYTKLHEIKEKVSELESTGLYTSKK